MRKIIETTSTLILWAVFIIGSTTAVLDFFFNADASEMIKSHLSVIALTPLFAVLFLGGMLIAVRFSKFDNTKKTIPSEHTILWTAEDLANAQSGKVVDLHFAGSGLACQVVARAEAATVLHIENQTVHVTVAPIKVEETSWNLQKIATTSLVIAIIFAPSTF